MNVGGRDIIYNGEKLSLVIWFDEPVLFIQEPRQRELPKMEFCGGYPDEWCIFIKKLTEEEKKAIRYQNGNPVNWEDVIKYHIIDDEPLHNSL